MNKRIGIAAAFIATALFALAPSGASAAGGSGRTKTRTGTVTWFNSTRGYGQIRSGRKNFIAHFSQVNRKGFRTLRAGETVRFRTTTRIPKPVSKYKRQAKKRGQDMKRWTARNLATQITPFPVSLNP